MEQEVDRIAIGTRFEINQLGAIRCPTLAGKTGTVIDSSPRNTGVTVLFDGSNRPTCLCRDYISPRPPSRCELPHHLPLEAALPPRAC
jgi:hypothetical protein